MSRSHERRYEIELHRNVVAKLQPWFVSLTIDTSVMIGGRWWGERRGTREGLARDRTPPLNFDHPEFRRWARRLSPAIVRIGGTEADRIRYAFKNDAPNGESIVDRSTAEASSFVLKGKLWKKTNDWARDLGFQILFTVAAGPESRSSDGIWEASEAARLMRNTVRKNYPVVAWELGNEVNAYPFLYGWKSRVTRKTYAQDFQRFSELVRSLAPYCRTVGPASAVWPLIGEPNAMIPAFCRSPAARCLDTLSYHYYPQQSFRGTVAVRRAKESTLLNSRTLDGALRWVRHAQKALRSRRPDKVPIWITETGHALYGGEPGLSDTWCSTIWWIDQLGLLAHAGVEAVFRQSLVGSDYGLLDPIDFSPRPDYFATLAWKTWMGPLVHDRPSIQGPNKKLRAWHHEFESGKQTVLLVNLDRRRPALVEFARPIRGCRTLTGDAGLTSRRVRIDAVTIDGERDFDRAVGREPRAIDSGSVRVPPLAFAFVELD